MTRWSWLAALLVLAGAASQARALPVVGPVVFKFHDLRLHGHLVDHTNRHGADRRIWSEALQRWCTFYVYLPPGYDPCQRYPLVVWLHGYVEDDLSALILELPQFDKAIARGRLPPTIVLIPNGHIPGTVPFKSHFLNTKQGRYEDYLIQDLLHFVMCNYPVRPEREAHAIMGFSISGWAAYSVALKNRDVFGVVIGILPPLNMRWLDCHGNYKADFDPRCWGWRNELVKNETLGWGLCIRATLKRAVQPYFGWGPSGLAWLSWENPIDILDRLNVQPGELAMYVAYVRRDQFNVDAQVESFLYRARQRGLCVAVDYHPKARHNVLRCIWMMPKAIDWLGVQFAPYGPPACPVKQ
jgi:hypothetical protein